MPKLKAFHTIIGGTIALSFIYLTLSLSTFYAKFEGLSYYHSHYIGIVEGIILVLSLSSFIFASLTYYTWSAKKIFIDRKKLTSLTLLFRFYLYTTFALVSLLIGFTWFEFNEVSASYILFLGVRFYVYPEMIALSTLTGFGAILYLYLFVQNEYYQGVSEIHLIICVILLILAAILSVQPENFYGVYTPEGVRDVRPLTNLTMLIYALFTVFYTVRILIKKIREGGKRIRLIRLKTVSLGFSSFLGFFIFYLLDALLGGGKPLTYFMIPAYLSLLMSSILIYLGFISPKWFEDIFVKDTE